jgi:membrane protease subunit (stomatin/prohibitin family)
MRKKMLLLALSLAAAAASLTAPSAVASGTHSCPRCTTYADGSQCCVSCICNSSGFPIACTNNFCPPAGGA